MAAEYCENCAQSVSGETAKRAEDPKQKFCCCCSFPKDAEGHCTSTSCKYGGKTPDCSKCR